MYCSRGQLSVPATSLLPRDELYHTPSRRGQFVNTASLSLYMDSHPSPVTQVSYYASSPRSKQLVLLRFHTRHKPPLPRCVEALNPVDRANCWLVVGEVEWENMGNLYYCRCDTTRPTEIRVIDVNSTIASALISVPKK